MTFGYHRVGVIIALVNAVSIFAIAAVIFYEAARRWQQPPEVNSGLMLGAAIVGLGVNVFIAFWLRKEQRTNLNVRSAFWHVMGDALASVGVIIGAVIIMLTGWFIVDPIISMLIGLIITLAAWRILKEGLKVLLEATPQQVDVHRMVSALKKIKGVKDVHDVHVWSISPELHAMSCHIMVDDLPLSRGVKYAGNWKRCSGAGSILSTARFNSSVVNAALTTFFVRCTPGNVLTSRSPKHTKHLVFPSCQGEKNAIIY